MKKAKKAIKLTFVILIGTVVLVGIMMYLEMLPQIPLKIFSDIEEIKSYDKYTVDYLEENNDSHILQDMIITDCTIRELKYKGHKYMLYAYIFESNEMAQNYYQSYGLDTTKNAAGSFHLESRIGGNAIFVCYGYNCAYKIIGDSYINMRYLLNECSSAFTMNIVLEAIKPSGS